MDVREHVIERKYNYWWNGKNLSSIRHLKAGVEHGWYTIFYQGKVTSSWKYEDGKPLYHKLYTYGKDGRLILIDHFKDGKRLKTVVFFWEDGKVVKVEVHDKEYYEREELEWRKKYDETMKKIKEKEKEKITRNEQEEGVSRCYQMSIELI